MAKKISFGTWKARAIAYAERQLGTGDLFDESDPYDIKEAFDPQRAYDSDQTPSSYVRGVFEEDFAMKAYDRDLAKRR